MNHVKALGKCVLGGVLAFGLTQMAAAEGKPGAEKCFGVVKAGKNDCQTASSACAGQSKRDGQKDAWIYVPKGSCEKIVGGSLQANG